MRHNWPHLLPSDCESCESEGLGQAALATGVSAGCRQGTRAVPCHSNGAAELRGLLSALSSPETCGLERGLAKWCNTLLCQSVPGIWFVKQVIFKVSGGSMCDDKDG